MYCNVQIVLDDLDAGGRYEGPFKDASSSRSRIVRVPPIGAL